jgi:hypothetical protein
MVICVNLHDLKFNTIKMKKINVAINGFGRIGRVFLNVLLLIQTSI